MQSGKFSSALVGAVIAAVALPGAAGASAEDPATILKEGGDAIVAHDGAGVISLTREGDEQQLVASGMGDQFMGVPADPKAQYRIGSNTKAFVSTVLLQLEAEGKLSMDDTVEKWLPGAVHGNGNDGSKITIRQLLNHTSGLYDYLTDPGILLPWIADLNLHQKYPPQQLVDVANAKQPYFPPGEGWHYSNTNYILAGMVIEAVTGNRPDVEVTRRIIEPLGLTNTTYPHEDPELHGNWLHGYILIRDVSFSNVQVSGAAGAMVSTLEDQAKFERALLKGELLPPAQMKEMQSTVPTDGKGTEYGLGIIRVQTPCGPAWSHTGGVIGYQTLWLSSPDAERQIVMAHNVYMSTSSLLPIFDENMGSVANAAFCA